MSKKVYLNIWLFFFTVAMFTALCSIFVVKNYTIWSSLTACFSGFFIAFFYREYTIKVYIDNYMIEHGINVNDKSV